jgi:hypothetical protein
VPLLSKNVHTIVNKQLSKQFKRILFSPRINIEINDTVDTTTEKEIQQIISR